MHYPTRNLIFKDMQKLAEHKMYKVIVNHNAENWYH